MIAMVVDISGLTDDDLDEVARQLREGTAPVEVREYVQARQLAHLLEAAGLSLAAGTREAVTV